MPNRIRVVSVKQGLGRAGCSPKGVQVQFQTSRTHPGDGNADYMRSLFEERGFRTRPGNPVPDLPLALLCVWADGRQLESAEVFTILRDDPYIDLSDLRA